MATPSSGTISLNEVHVEAGGSSGSQCSFNDSDIRSICAGVSSGATFAMSSMYARAADGSFSGTNAAWTTTYSAGYISITTHYRGYVSNEQGAGNYGSMSPDTNSDYMGGSKVINMALSSIGIATGKTLAINAYPAAGYTISNNDNEVFNSIVIGSTTFDRGDFSFSANNSGYCNLQYAYAANTGFYDGTSTAAPFPAVNATYYGSFRRRV